MIDDAGINCAGHAKSERFYDAVLRDPGGNNVEAVFRGILP